jgi:ribosomal protein S18 acetylase RimI-like enzyme
MAEAGGNADAARMIARESPRPAAAATDKRERILLRPASEADSGFLFDVYASTRAEELALVNWSSTQRDAFVTMQHRAQDAHYRTHFPDARFAVIESDGRPAGRLYVARQGDEIRILDIALLPEYCGRGIGTTLLRTLQAEARSTGKQVVLHVERHSRARHLYLRLGFVPVEEKGMHLRMEWAATARPEDPFTRSRKEIACGGGVS